MKNWVKISLTGIGLAGAGIGLAFWSGARSWNAETARIVEKLKLSATEGATKTVSFKDFDDLPAPVARYFRLALKDGQPIVRTARIRYAGEFKLNGKWTPFDSEQHFSANPPAFVWDADMKMNPLMNVRVRDGFTDGKGSMNAKIFALFSVMNAHDDVKLDAGALQRYLAELAWLPTALLPSENLHWTAIDENRASATLTDGKTTVSLEFRFNDAGELIEAFTPARFYGTNGEYKTFPWLGRFWNYEERGGMMIPIEGEVEWQMPEGAAPYFKGRIVEAEYDFAK
ncbi:MAG: hypothetical protein LH472_10140 [Pyrinomonadaceae bacterium]|nr:hypothetical protein [Pyrinomonadaceae bacterium]